ncbi:hypothetical protein [Isobaculum melis]|uniref:MucBP domain-containing protein n=1 Tax=Isobaculum melis TaxID=142588 RepID=A0A1H9R3P3_9LACT|nr:hypothetical protein [Isobaculum melis]SER67332.1 hypothetical protein SAMN04488559_10337 [Isobaculum melis]
MLNYAASSNIYGRTQENAVGGFIFDGKDGVNIPLLDEKYGSFTASSQSEGTLDMTTMKIDKTIKGNASKAELVPSKNAEGKQLEKANIKKAYLVTESSLDMNQAIANPSIPSAEAVTELQNMGNRPMTLVGPSGATMQSNGYLPENFSVAYDKSYKSTNASIDTSTDSLSSQKPTILYTLGAYNYRLRASTITDVTDFVKQEGYGDYYGYHIPSKHDKTYFADVASGWKLIIVEEDATMPYSRVGNLQLGMINSNNEVIGTGNLNLAVKLDGYTTPVTGDFKGQLFFSSVGSNPQGEQYLVKYDPDDSGKLPSFYLETRDRAGGNIHRGYTGTSKSFGQNIISIDGQRRTDISSYRTTPKGNQLESQWTLADYLAQSKNAQLYTDGMDVELLNVTNKQGNIAAKDTLHNAYIANGASGISFSVTPSFTGDNFITALGILTETELPVFKSAIIHELVEVTPEDPTIYTTEQVKITASAENVTSKNSNVTAMTDTQVTMALDNSLIPDWSKLTLTFKKYAPNGTFIEYSLSDFSQAPTLESLQTNKTSNTYFIDLANKTITINFGTDETVYASEEDKLANKGKIGKLYNNVGDHLEVSVIAKTDTVAKENVTNTVKVTGGNAITNSHLIVPIQPQTYSNSTDAFTTYRRDLLLHVRQIVVNPQTDLVQPTFGYGAVNSQKEDGSNVSTYSVKMNSGTNPLSLFDAYTIRYPKENKRIRYQQTIPEYYQVIGYVATPSNTPHAVENVVPSVNIDTEVQAESWISVYITPVTDEIKPYSWDYLEKPLGTIKK